MASALISRALIIVFGLLYPAYYSYKAIKTRNVTEYVKWMMYWIVFALFYNVETIADLLISWFPMYYELKVVFVIWLLSPATRGSDVLYRLYIHPYVTQHEQEIEKTLEKVKSQSYSTLISVGAQGMNLALQGAIAGQTKLADQLKKTYSISSDDETDSVISPEYTREERRQLHNSQSESYLPAGAHHSSSYNELSLADNRILEETGLDNTLRHRHPCRSQSMRTTSPQCRRPYSPPTHSGGNFSRSDSRERRTVNVSPVSMRSVRHSPTLMSKNATSDKEYSESPATNTRSMRTSRSTPGLSHSHSYRHSQSSPLPPRASRPQTPTPSSQQQNRPNIAKPVTRPKKNQTLTQQAPSNTADSENLKEEEQSKPKQKSRFTESTLRYRTKKISDIKSHKIESPFISLF